ncbi:hypothetical protein M011DRAFT_470320 [Sporormia fimetaria CBS 119925]|uniref:C3H1-type domain-containing protein n=1 Tax=Sporormia fimetaria CBS 119925 TaxID=1340428 RepID=A0A6A6V571_9PLEO|nr:hypothetical protein M011DRAFT_470320 [Sporormia fimetaria CBS 119925]
MASQYSFPDIESQLATFKRSDEARERLLENIVRQYGALLEEHNIVCADFMHERDSRRRIQLDVQKAEKQALDAQQQLEKQSAAYDEHGFVLCLIDGDGVIFRDALLAAGTTGGSEAASKLHDAIRAHIEGHNKKAAHWTLVTHIYLSLEQLGKTLVKCGVLKHHEELRAFAQAFNVNQPLFNIIDVGYGKERADYKIKETLRAFIDNPTCKHIYFGGCHDTGYLVNFEKYKHNEEISKRITLIEATTPHGLFEALPFDRTRFDAVFRNEELRALSPIAQTQKPASLPFRNSNGTVNGHSEPSSSSPTTDKTTGTSNYAIISRASPAAHTITPSTKATDTDSNRWIYFNKDDQRLDEPLPPKTPRAEAALEERMKRGKKLCNQYHLSGYCGKGASCPYQHAPDLNPAEKNALRYLARRLPCNPYCERFDCYLGHSCHLEAEGYCKFGQSCNFKEVHRMDKRKHTRMDLDGNFEKNINGQWQRILDV